MQHTNTCGHEQNAPLQFNIFPDDHTKMVQMTRKEADALLKEVNTEDPSKSWSVSGWPNEDNWTDEYRYWKRTYTKLFTPHFSVLIFQTGSKD